MKDKKTQGLYKFIVFFLLISFVVTASFLLFMHYMEFDKKQILMAAPITFGNVVFITLIFWLFDNIRNKIFTDRPVKKITKGLAEIANGKFDTRIKPMNLVFGNDNYNEIINYINIMAGELEGVEVLKTDFVSNVSHEMKTPLAAIRNYAQLLKSSDISEDERKEYAQAIDENTQRLSSLVVNILKLNKLENQQIYPQKSKYNLSEQLCETLLEFENVWEEKEIEIETDIKDDVYINADPELLFIVWQNLISNALKFTNKNGKVKVELYEEVSDILVLVTDSGCGMDAKTGKHIFEKFYQGDTSHAGRGNGIGLALVKRIIDITGSEITVDSEVGKGSTFAVRLKKD